MPSVKSYFNRSLFRGTLGRTWPLWAAYTLAWLLIMPVWLFTMLNRYHIVSSQITVSYDILNMSINAGIAAAAFSGICFAMAMFSYLSSSRTTYGMHTMPIRREGLFSTHYLAGLFAQVVTLVFVFALAALVAACHGVFDAYALGMGLVINLLLVLFFYSFGVLCMVCAGQILAGAAFYGIFNFVFIAMEALIQTFAGNFLYGYVSQSNFVTMFLSPLFRLYSSLGASKVYPQTADGDIRWDLEPIGVKVMNFRYAPIYAFAGVAFAVIALALYRRRKSEATGSTVAVTWLRPVFKYGVALCSAFSFGQLLSYFVFELTESPYAAGALIGTIACMVFAGLLGYYAAEMLLKKSFRVFKSAWKGALATAVALVLIGASFPLDLTGYQSYVPAADEIESAQINIYTGGNINNHFELEDEESIALLRDAHYACILDKARQTSVNRYEPHEQYCNFVIIYFLDDGTVVRRNYDLTLDPALLSDPSSPEGALTALVSCSEITRQRILGGSLLPDDLENVRVTGGHVDCSYYPEGEYSRSDDAELDAIQANNVFIALMQDCVEGNVETATIFGENEIGREPTTKPGIPDEYYLNLELWYFDSSRAGESYTVAVEYDKSGAEIDYNASLYTRVTPEMTATMQTLRELNVIYMPWYK